MIGGKPAKPGLFPFMAAVTWMTNAGASASCSGFIVSPTAIMAAAHCIHTSNSNTYLTANYSAQVGSVNRKKGTHVRLKEIIHPKYNRKTNENDIAILKTMKGKLPLGDNAKPISLEGRKRFDKKRHAYSMGWGRTTMSSCKLVKETTDNFLHIATIQGKQFVNMGAFRYRSTFLFSLFGWEILKSIKGKLPLGDNAKPISLEGRKRFDKKRHAYSMGWGRTTMSSCVNGKSSAEPSDVLLYHLQKIKTVGEKKIHVKSSKSKTCMGDSGSPLVTKQKGEYIAFGILSTADDSRYGDEMYVRIFPQKKFILKHAKDVKFSK